MSQIMKATSIKVNTETWRMAKVLAAHEDKDIQDVVDEALNSYLSQKLRDIAIRDYEKYSSGPA